MQESYTILYKCGHGSAYFDALYGALAIGNKKPQKNCILCYPFIYNRTKRFTLLFSVLFFLLDGGLFLLKKLEIAQFLHPLVMIMMIVAFVFAVFHAFMWYTVKKSYKTLLKSHNVNEPEQGRLTIDASGVCDEVDNGEVIKHPWFQYDSCIITPRVIVIRTKTGTHICLSSTHETAQMVGDALTAFGYGNTIYVCTLKE